MGGVAAAIVGSMFSESRLQAADLIARFVAGNVGEWEWDDFLSVTSPDPVTEAARRRCAVIRDDFPAFESGAYCGPVGVAALSAVAEELRKQARDA